MHEPQKLDLERDLEGGGGRAGELHLAQRAHLLPIGLQLGALCREEAGGESAGRPEQRPHEAPLSARELGDVAEARGLPPARKTAVITPA